MVAIILKNLQQETFTVEIELTATVRALKEKIEKEKGSQYPADGQKLIYAGKILEDGTLLETYKIDLSKFLVIMVTKPKTSPISSAPADPTVQAAEEAAASEKETIETTTAATTTSTTSTATTTSSAETTTTSAAPASGQANAESTIVVGDEFNKMVDNIMEMGYERPQVERALRASFNNPYTAVQYLVDGIPADLEASQAEDEVPPADAPATTGPATETVSGSIQDPLDFLRAQPQFSQMRQMIRSNPQLLDAFIQQIGQTNPELLRVIQENQEDFVRMLNESGNTTESTRASTGGSVTSPPSGERSQGSSIVVSPQDRDAIDRLKSLGNFPEDVVVQAYFACEKNENLAAEFLFSQTWD